MLLKKYFEYLSQVVNSTRNAIITHSRDSVACVSHLRLSYALERTDIMKPSGMFQGVLKSVRRWKKTFKLYL